MSNDEKKKKQESINEIPVCYCTKCLSLRIKRKQYILYCDSCGADAFHLDSTSIFRWQQLCEARGKSHLIAKKTSVYDDIDEVFQEQAVERITEAECIENGTAAGVKITDYLYRNLHNLDRRSNPTEKVLKQITDRTINQLTEKVMEQVANINENNAINSTDNE